jgi:hypothetical protein
LDNVVFDQAARDEGDIPFLEPVQIARLKSGHVSEDWPTWFTSPYVAEDGDFAVQQHDSAMGPTAPFGCVAVFRPTGGSFEDGDIVLVDVGADVPRYVIRRAYLVRGEVDQVEGMLVRVDVPGKGDEYEYHDAVETQRVIAVLVGYQEV